MYFEDFNGETTVLGAVIMMVISAICGGACGIAVGDKLNANDVFTIYYVILSMINGIFCFVLCYPILKFIATVFITFVMPLIHLMDEKTTLIGIDVLCIPVIAANLFFLLCCIAQWREETVDEVMKKLNGFDPYFIRIRSEIFKRSGYTDLKWGVSNLSAVKLFKLAHKARILDKEDATEQRRRAAYEEKDERRKIRFLNMIDI